MIRELLQALAQLTPAELHVGFLIAMVASAALTLLAACGAAATRGHGGPLVRGGALVASALLTGAMLIALGAIPLGAGEGAAALEALLLLHVGAMAGASLVIGATATAARTAALVAAAQGMASVGTLVFLMLLGAVLPGVDSAWEVRHLTEFTLLTQAGFVLLLGVAFVSARAQGVGTRVAYAAAAAASLTTITIGLLQHADPGPAIVLPTLAPPLLAMAWLGALQVRRAAAGRSALVAWWTGLTRRAANSPLFTWALLLSPVALASVALIFAGSGSAREASRVSLGGLSITPGLLSPFLFAVALGLLVGRERQRWQGWGGVLLTALMAALLFAQKEVGNTAVLCLVAATIYLVARGTILHLSAGAGLGLVAVVVAYQLQPVLPFIPFTVRERIHLWLGGAELLQRGGHLVTAGWVTYKLGGFWGLGLGELPGVNLTRLVIAIHTDFPLAVIGLFGGFPLLSAYIAFFTAAAIALLDTVRSLSFEGDARRARWQAPILAGLLAIPVTSTLINLAGAITRVTPFTGVPVMLVSYSSTFLFFTWVILAVFVLAGNRDAIRAQLRADADEAAQAQAPPPRLTVTEPPAGDAPRQEPTAATTRAPTGPHPAPRGSSLTRARLLSRRFSRLLRFNHVDGGVLVISLATLALAAIFVQALYDRYTDRARYHGHPRLTHALRVEPLPGQPGRWAITEAPDDPLVGALQPEQRLRLDDLVLEHRDDSLRVIGACFPAERFDGGVALGFAGMLDAPDLPLADEAIEPALARLVPAGRAPNDLVLPFGDVALHDTLVTRVRPGLYRVQRASTASSARVLDHQGRPMPFTDFITHGQQLEVGALRPRRFRLDADRSGAVCLTLDEGAIFQYSLAHDGPTLLGPNALLARQLGGRSTDLTFAEDLKAAAEAGVLTAAGPQGPLRVIPHAPADRAAWDSDTARAFDRVFDILRVKQPDGSTVEALAWARPFYQGGDRRFSGDRELGAFLIRDQQVLGLADSYRFSQLLPLLYDPFDPQRNGLITDRHERPVTQLDPAQGTLLNTLPGGGALVGYDFRKAGIRDGLLRIFTLLLRGAEPLPDVNRELHDRLDAVRPGPWGHDVALTIDRDVQREAFAILEDEVRKLDRKEPDTLHHASAVVLGPRNEIIAAVQLPDPGDITSIDAVKIWKQHQVERPLDAAALDAFHRRTTMGSTIKLLAVTSAFRYKDDVLLRDERGEYYPNATDDPRNAVQGRFIDHCSVASWRGQPIAPIRNFGGSCYGDVVSIRELLVRSINTASAYIGMNLGRERFTQLFTDTGLTRDIDLLPAELGTHGAYGHLVSRYPRDAATGLPVALANIPASEPWTLSLTARLPLSGLSDYSTLNTALAASIIARDGLYWPPSLVVSLRSKRTGVRTPIEPPTPIRILPTEDARAIKSYMKDTVLRGTAGGYKRGVPEEVWRNTGAKTGTGETTVPVNKGAVYSLSNKPRTRDNKAFVAFWPIDDPQPFVVVVVFEQISHLDTGVAIRTSRRIMEALRLTHASGPLP